MLGDRDCSAEMQFVASLSRCARERRFCDAASIASDRFDVSRSFAATRANVHAMDRPFIGEMRRRYSLAEKSEMVRLAGPRNPHSIDVAREQVPRNDRRPRLPPTEALASESRSGITAKRESAGRLSDAVDFPDASRHKRPPRVTAIIVDTRGVIVSQDPRATLAPPQTVSVTCRVSAAR